MQPEIIPLFPQAVYIANIERNFEPSELDELSELYKDVHKNMGNWATKNSHILDTKLPNIRKFIQEHIDLYVKKIISPKEDVEFYITQSWINVTNPQEYHHRHSHFNSILSGVFYIDVVDMVDTITFSDSNKKWYHLVPNSQNEFNSEDFYLRVSKGDLVIFPSDLVHSVEKTKLNKPRISLAFNTFLRGNIGDDKFKTGLNLK
jgi:uncharacterized protein (TIGR02466 family)